MTPTADLLTARYTLAVIMGSIQIHCMKLKKNHGNFTVPTDPYLKAL